MYLVYAFRAIEKILPALKGTKKWGWLPGFALCLLVLFATLGFGIYADGEIIHPPQQYTGHCSAPAVIKGGNCLLITTFATTNSGTVSAVTRTEQAGVIENMTTTVTQTVTK